MATSRYFLFVLILFIASCKKDDLKDRDLLGPVITITGNNPETIFLNSNYTDAGATANDANDGGVSVTSDISSANPNTDSTGTYLITYTAKDAAGNKSTAVRTVIVVNSSTALDGLYTVTSTVNGNTTTYSQAITADRFINNRIHFSDFGNYSNNTHLYANVVAGGLLQIPVQYVVNIGQDNGNACDVVNHKFQSSSCTLNTDGFTIEYTDEITVPASCQANMSCTAVFVR